MTQKNSIKIEGSPVQQVAAGENIEQIIYEAPDPQLADSVQRRSEVFTELYKQIADVSRLFKSHNLVEGREATIKFHEFIDQNRLYFIDTNLVMQLENFSERLTQVIAYNIVIRDFSQPGHDDEICQKERQDCLRSILEIVNKDLPRIRIQFEAEMQRILGMKQT